MSQFEGNLFSIEDARREFRALIEPVQNNIESISNNLQSLTTTVGQGAVNNFAPIVNILDNSHPEWSKDAYLTLGVDPALVSDGNTECYDWFRVGRNVTALAKSSADALKSTGHSLFAANEGGNENIPRWDRTNGQIELGGTSEHWDLLYQLPANLVSQGLVFYIQFEAMLRTTDPLPSNLQIFAEFFDATAGQEKTIGGGNFTITGEVYRSPGEPVGAQTVRYQVKARTDSGEEAISNILELTNAPTVFTQNNHPRINLNGAPGFIEFEIYKQFGGVFYKQFVVRNSIDSTYFDVGNPPISTVAGFPGLTATAPKARAVTTTFAPGTLTGTGFRRNVLTIFVPTTYNKSLTAPNKQWLRIGLTAFCDVPRQIVLRRLGLSQGDAQWARSAGDQQSGIHSAESNAPVSAPPGGSGTGTAPPPESGGGGYDCVLLETNITVRNGNGFDKIPLAELRGRENFFVDSASAICGRVRKVRIGQASKIIRVKTECGRTIGATFEEPFFTSDADTYGIAVWRLKKRFDAGEKIEVMIKPFETVEKAGIISMEIEYGSFDIGITEQEGSHILIANDFLIDNRKLDSEVY